MNNYHFDDVFLQYKSKGILIDSNLLLLYFIGKYSPDRITKFKRTSIFTIDDFDIIESVFQYFNKIVTTPNILTEVSNLSGQLPEGIRKDCFKEFRKIITTLNEEYYASQDISSEKQFLYFGLTDTGIIKAAKGKYLVFTEDMRLYNALLNLKIDVVNINHIRTYRWFGVDSDKDG
ncbi:MAG: PIN domain-containing protein [Candidatus Hatepunaea meridiana]|nr:PIN domain-containing protein [Candidatus Hatepunaea meridiana]